MANSINTNPDALRAMVRELRQADAAIEACIRKVQAALNASHWHDNVRNDFDRNLETIGGLARQMSNVSADCQRMLNGKAKQLEDYLR